MMKLPEVGIQSSQSTSQFSLAYTARKPTNRVELKIITSHPVTCSVLYGSAAMTCTAKSEGGNSSEYHYEIHNPPMGSQVVTGTFSDDVLFVVRLFDDAWLS